MNNFFANLYEIITGQNDLSNLLFQDEGVYITVGFLMPLMALIGTVVYYYVINHPSFNRWYHWLLMMVVICLINFGIAYAMADGIVFNTHGTVEGFIPQITTFGLTNVIWTLVAFIVFSFCIKWKSRNAKYSPF